MFPKQIHIHVLTFNKIMWWVESLQKDNSLKMTVAAIPQEQHIYYAICCLFAQQEESLAGKQWSDELCEWATPAHSLQIEHC